MDGGGIARDVGKTITTWRREDIFVDEPGEREQQLGTGKDVAITAGNGRICALWINAGQLEAWSGGKPEPIAKEAAFPALVALPGGGFLAAWESGARSA